MRSGAPGSVAAFLLLIPVLVVPLLAIFGIPQIAPVHAPAKLEEEFPDLAATVASSPSSRVMVSPHGGKAEPQSTDKADEAAPWQPDEPPLTKTDVAKGFPVRKDGVLTAEVPGNSGAKPMPFPEGESVGIDARPKDWPNDKVASTEEPDLWSGTSSDRGKPESKAASSVDEGITGAGFERSDVPPVEKLFPKAGGKGAAPLTWANAVKRLDELEIRSFRLEPGAEPQQFVFICSYTPADNPRISYRFEAEANEPLRAVEKVLEQIQEWKTNR